MQLLNSSDGSLLVAQLATVTREIHIDLARAEDDAFNVFALLDFTSFMCRVLEDPLEVGFARECADLGACKWMTQQTLAEEQDKRYNVLAYRSSLWMIHTFSELAVHLTAKNVEQVAGLG